DMLVKRLAFPAAIALLLTAAVSMVGAREPVRGARQNPQAPPTAAPAAPKLVVLIVLDQVRADYLERFADEWTGGLQRMMKTGAWFTKAAYPYLVTATCAGHATISTGALPHRHGVVHNEWFDRRQNRGVACADDPSVHNIAYGGQATGGNSAAALRIPALAERLHSERGGRVATLSLKERSAIM